MKVGTQILSIALLGALIGAGWLQWTAAPDASSKIPARKKSGATLVLVEPATLADDNVVVRAIGTGQARRAATIHAATAGEVVRVNFEAQQRVTKGAILLRLDDKHQRLAVRLAEVTLKEASRQLKRLEKLAPSGATSMARLETAQTTLESASLRLDQAKADLRDRTVYAPFNGIVGLTEIDVGDRITVDTPIAILDDRSYIKVAFNLPEEYAARATVGTLVVVYPRTMPDMKVEGAISATGSRIDPLTRSLKVEAEIVNTDDTLRPGTSFEVQLSFVGKSYPSVREVAVSWSRDGAYLWRVEGDRVKKVFVKNVHRDAGRILVDGPLKAGEMIVVEGVQGLRANQRVKTKLYDAESADTKKPPTIKSPS